MATLHRHQSHVLIRWEHRRRHEQSSPDEMTAKKLHRLQIRKGLIAASMKRALFTPPLPGQGTSAFSGNVIATAIMAATNKDESMSFHHCHFRIASSHSVKSRDNILLIAFSHDGAEKMCTAKLASHATSP